MKKRFKHNVHECIKKIQDNAERSDNSITFIEFELSNIQNTDLLDEIFKTAQPIKIYRKNKNGNEKITKTFISHNFCPFCGKKF